MQAKQTLLVRLGLFGLSMLFLQACSKSTEDSPQTVTQLNQLLKGNSSVCAKSLLEVGQSLIKQKQHGLQVLNNATFSLASLQQTEADKPQSQLKIQSNIISVVGTLVYKDRPSHIRMDAVPVSVEDAEQKIKPMCQVTYQLNYVLDESCVVMRENAFKKWTHQQDVNQNTSEYRHKRKPYQTAFLTKVDRNRKCLVNVTSSQIKPATAQ